MTILYQIHNNLYVNLTNRCPCACTFCLRQTRTEIKHSGNLWLEHEPSEEEIIQEFDNYHMENYEEIIFCGFGEPLERLDIVLNVSDFLKKKFQKKIRVNTNGLGNLIWNQDITPKLHKKIDTLSISLNTPDPKLYYKLTKSKFGPESFQAMLDFANKAKKYVPHIIMTTVATTLSTDEEEKCQELCKSLGLEYHIRPWEN